MCRRWRGGGLKAERDDEAAGIPGGEWSVCHDAQQHFNEAEELRRMMLHCHHHSSPASPLTPHHCATVHLSAVAQRDNLLLLKFEISSLISHS